MKLPPSSRSSRTPSSTHALRRADLAYAELASSEVARDINRDIILELVRTRQPVSRVDLSRLSGLHASTVSAIVEQLLAENWIVEGGTERRPRGRHPTLLSLNEDMVILAVDLRPGNALVAVVDLNGRLLMQESILLGSRPERGVEHLIASLQRMRDAHPTKSFEGIGLSVPGRVDPASRRLILAPNLHWTGYDIAGELEQALDLKVEMENEANACLIAEVWSGRLDGVRNAVLVAISEGIGTAILTNGQMVTGMAGMAGEFGHVSLDPSGPRCGCGRHGCWEMFGSTRAAVRYYCEATGAEPDTVPSQRLLTLADDEIPAAVDALTRQAEALGRGLQVVCAALAPEVILLTGDLTSAWQRFCPIIEKQLRRELLAGDPPRLLAATNPQFARLRGAAALVLQRHSGFHRSHQSGNDRGRSNHPTQESAAAAAV